MSDSHELLKPSEVTYTELHTELSNSETNEAFTVLDVDDIQSLKEENEGLKRLLDKRSPLVLSDFYVELQKLRERNRELRLKIGEERRSSIVQISDLKRQLDGVTDKELQNELSNLKAENEKLRADYAALLESSTHVTNKLREEVREVRSQLEQERVYKKDVEDECWDKEESLNQTRAELLDREKELAVALAEVLDLKQKLAPGVELPEAADLLNQLKKAKGKKFTASLAEVEAILEMLEP